MELSKLYLTPTLNTGDPFILTHEKSSGPFSFYAKSRPYSESLPIPVYLSPDDLNFKKDYGTKNLFNSFKICKNGDL